MQSIRSKKFNPIITLRSRIYSGHLEVAWLLLYKLNHVKAEWEKRNHISRNSKRTEFITKIDPNYKSEHKLSLLEDACSSVVKGRAKHDIVDLLLHYGANVNPRNSPFVPLAYATLHGNQNLAEILLAHHADPNVRLPSKDGSSEHIFNGKVITNDTVLITATDLNLPKLLEALLFHNAQVNLTSSKGTALCVAAEKGYLELVKMLLDCDADVNAIRLIDNTTPLCLAANNGHSAVVSTLLKHGANVGHEVEPGYTAIAYAYQNSHTAIVKILREAGANV
jgi:ankyrin repeat protein